MSVTSINNRKLIDLEVIFWIESNVVSSAVSRSGYDALLSQIHLYLRSRVSMEMRCDLAQMAVSGPINRMRWFPTLRRIERETCFNSRGNWLDERLKTYLIAVWTLERVDMTF